MERRSVVRGAAPHAAALVVAAALAAAGCGKAGAGAEAATADAVLELGPADVAVARRSDLAAGVELTGSLLPYQMVTVKAQVVGTVASVHVDRGVPVRAGQVLATVSADGIRSQAAAAESNLALAQQRLESAEALHAAGAMSEIDLKAARAAYEAARAQAAAAGESAAKTMITAPITGVVSARTIEAGEAVNPGQELFTVVNSEILELAAQVPVEAAARIRPGLPVVFRLDAFPGREFRGAVDRVEPMADPETRQVGIYVRLPNRGGEIIAGQFATGRILGERIEDALVVPATAVRRSGEETYVLAIRDGEVVRSPVRLGPRDEAAGLVAILSGVSEGEAVVAAPAAALAPGTKVRVGAGAPEAEDAGTGAEGR